MTRSRNNSDKRRRTMTSSRASAGQSLECGRPSSEGPARSCVKTLRVSRGNSPLSPAKSPARDLVSSASLVSSRSEELIAENTPFFQSANDRPDWRQLQGLGGVRFLDGLASRRFRDSWLRRPCYRHEKSRRLWVCCSIFLPPIGLWRPAPAGRLRGRRVGWIAWRGTPATRGGPCIDFGTCAGGGTRSGRQEPSRGSR